MLCRLRGPLAAFLLGLAGAPALATPAWQPQAQPIEFAKPFGPGSPGFLPTCSSTFAVANELKQAGNFTTAPWSAGSVGGTASVAAAPGVTDPLGGHNTYLFTQSALTASGTNHSTLSTLYNGYHANYPNTNDVYVMGPPGRSASISITATGATYLARQSIVLNGKWQRVGFTLGTLSSGSYYYQIGADMRDSTATGSGLSQDLYHYYTGLYGVGGTIPAQNLYVFGAQAVEGKVELPYSPTTTTADYNTYAAITANCPPGVAFRNFASAQPPLPSTSTSNPLTYAGITICQGNQSGCPGPGSGVLGYQGVGPAMINASPSALAGGVWYGLANCINSAHATYLWGQCLYSTPDLTRPWSYVGAAVNPGTPTNTNLSYYILHATQLAAGCTYSSTFYAYCWLVGGETSSALSTGAISLLFTNSLASFPFGYSTSPVISGTTLSVLNFQYGAQTDPTLPSCMISTGIYYCYSSVADNGGNDSILYTISADADMASNSWTAFDYALRPNLSTDWDNGYHKLDNHVFLNKHGFYEYFYTAFNGANQYIGYAVSNSPYGPWWKQNACSTASNNPGCVIPKSSPWYGGTAFVGDVWVTERNGLFMLNENYDNGSSLSQAVVGFMPDY